MIANRTDEITCRRDPSCLPEQAIGRFNAPAFPTEPFDLLWGLVEVVIELSSHRDDCTPRTISAFVVGDSDDKAKTQVEKHLRSCADAASGECTPEAAVLH